MQKTKHTVEVIEPCLEIEEHLHQAERGWIIQKIGWIFILGVVLAGGLGVFGEGLVSSKSVSSGSSRAEFERFFRHEVEMKVLVESASHIASISFPAQYLKKFKMVRIIPEEASNTTANNEVTFNFTPGDNKIVNIYVTPKDYGSVSGTMRINDRDTFNLNHFIYP